MPIISSSKSAIFMEMNSCRYSCLRDFKEKRVQHCLCLLSLLSAEWNITTSIFSVFFSSQTLELAGWFDSDSYWLLLHWFNPIYFSR